MQLSEGLYVNEIIVSLCGIALFIIQIIKLARSNRAVSKWNVMLFIVAAVMIAYPTIQKIKFRNDLLEIRKATDKLEEAGVDSLTVKTLRSRLDLVERRPLRLSANLLTLAKAHAILGDSVDAVKYTNLALQANPDEDETRTIYKFVSLYGIKGVSPPSPLEDLAPETTAVLIPDTIK